MEPQNNHKINLQKAINAHTEAKSALIDVIDHSPDPVFEELLRNVERNLDALRLAATRVDS